MLRLLSQNTIPNLFIYRDFFFLIYYFLKSLGQSFAFPWAYLFVFFITSSIDYLLHLFYFV